jgi:hypothetical protein
MLRSEGLFASLQQARTAAEPVTAALIPAGFRAMLQ